jgi:hypothetical protein
MPDTLDAAELRRWAARCDVKANDGNCTAEDRDRLRKMRESLLALADNADWLAGTSASERSVEPIAD